VSIEAESPVIDPALFRLRLFVEQWVVPLNRVASNDPFSGDPQGPWVLSSVLRVEADRWIELGRMLGYFADEPIPGPSTRAAFPEDRFFNNPYALEFDDVTFSETLRTAMEDLTPARREFLSLVIFERDDLFEQRLEEVRELADALTAQPWLNVPARAVDKIEWSLDGAYLSPLRGTPAEWRGITHDENEAWTLGADRTRTKRTPIARRDAVDDVRRTAAKAIEWAIEYEQTPVELRAAQASRRGVDNPEASLPSWVREMGN